MEMGWTWANALDHDDSTDVYTLSLRNFGSIVSVDGATGACDWALGGLAGTVDIIGDTFEHQHQFARTDETMVVFDNDGEGTRSRVIEYAFDPTTGTAEQVWSYTFPLWNVVLGDVHRLDDGDTLVVWSVHGRVDRITPQGEVAAKLVTEEDMVIGFVALENDLYVPQ